MKSLFSMICANTQLTALIPLVGLTYLFHKTQWTPSVLPADWLLQGVEKGTKVIKHYGIHVTGEGLVRLALDFAAAYATVKVHYLTWDEGDVGFVAGEDCRERLAYAGVCEGFCVTYCGVAEVEEELEGRSYRSRRGEEGNNGSKQE